MLLLLLQKYSFPFLLLILPKPTFLLLLLLPYEEWSVGGVEEPKSQLGLSRLLPPSLLLLLMLGLKVLELWMLEFLHIWLTLIML